MGEDKAMLYRAICAGLSGALGAILLDGLDRLLHFEQWAGSAFYAMTVTVLVYDALLRWTAKDR